MKLQFHWICLPWTWKRLEGLFGR